MSYLNLIKVIMILIKIAIAPKSYFFAKILSSGVRSLHDTGHLTIQLDPINPSGVAPRNLWHLSVNSSHFSTLKPLFCSNSATARDQYSLPNLILAQATSLYRSVLPGCHSQFVEFLLLHTVPKLEAVSSFLLSSFRIPLPACNRIALSNSEITNSVRCREFKNSFSKYFFQKHYHLFYCENCVKSTPKQMFKQAFNLTNF